MRATLGRPAVLIRSLGMLFVRTLAGNIDLAALAAAALALSAEDIEQRMNAFVGERESASNGR